MRTPMTKAIDAVKNVPMNESVKIALLAYLETLKNTEEMEIEIAFDNGARSEGKETSYEYYARTYEQEQTEKGIEQVGE